VFPCGRLPDRVERQQSDEEQDRHTAKRPKDRNVIQQEGHDALKGSIGQATEVSGNSGHDSDRLFLIGEGRQGLNKATEKQVARSQQKEKKNGGREATGEQHARAAEQEATEPRADDGDRTDVRCAALGELIDFVGRLLHDCYLLPDS
jgi:hypothetical protein